MFVERLIVFVFGDFVGHAIQAGKGGGKDDARFVAQGVGQHPAIGEQCVFAGGAIVFHQRDAGVTQGLDAGGDRQLGTDVQRVDARGGHAKFLRQVKLAALSGQFDRVFGVVDDLKDGSGLAFDQTGDAPRGHLCAQVIGGQVDELFAAQDAIDVVIGKDALVQAGQTQRRAADHDRAGERQTPVERGGWGAGRLAGRLGGRWGDCVVFHIDLLSLRQEIGKELAQGDDAFLG